MRLTLPKWRDLHVHLRQGDLLQPLIQAHLESACCGVLAMPNTSPPVTRVFSDDPTGGWSVEDYAAMIRRAGGEAFTDIIVPLYLSRDTTPEMIAAGARAGTLKACKYYPPHGTTGAEFAYPFAQFFDNGVFAAMQEHSVALCVHGEEHALRPEAYFGAASNAESLFYRDRMPRLCDTYPDLRVVAEHITTRTAVDFVLQAPPGVAATVTPQHLLYTTGHLLQGLRYHLYCLPVVKFDEDREALRRAVTDPDNRRFFAGTDSAPHTRKATTCGCAAGCFTGNCAPQLYAEAFESSGVDLAQTSGQAALRRFLCDLGPRFYGLKPAQETFVLERSPQTIEPVPTPEGPVVPLPLGVERDTVSWTVRL